MQIICKMEKLEIREVIKLFCETGMSPKEIHEDFIETLKKESISYSTVKKWVYSLREDERALWMMDSLNAQKCHR